MLSPQQLSSLTALAPERQGEQIVRWRDAGQLDAGDMRQIARVIPLHLRDMAFAQAGPLRAWTARTAYSMGEELVSMRNSLIGLTERIPVGQDATRRAILRTLNGPIHSLSKPMSAITQPLRDQTSDHYERILAGMGDDAQWMLDLGKQPALDVQENRGALERTQAVQQLQAEVATWTDRMGMGVERNIQPLVASLNSWGVQTTMSCEGHAGDASWGKDVTAPWVSFSQADAPKVRRLLDETGGDWEMSARGSDEVELSPQGMARKIDHLLPAQRSPEHLAAMRTEGYRRAHQLSTSLNALPDKLHALSVDRPAPNLSDMRSPPSADLGHNASGYDLGGH